MDCNVIKDLIPLYIDGCCSEKSETLVKEHTACCDACKRFLEEMRAPTDAVTVSKAPVKPRKLREWRASVLQVVLFFVSFLLMTAGVAREAATTAGSGNGFWAMNLVVPAAGFMLSLANWYFVRFYKSRKRFTNGSLIATAGITLCLFAWTGLHYGMFNSLFFTGFSTAIYCLTFFARGILLTVLFCVLSKVLSDRYAKMVGKE